jgi:hypothetical protein
MNYMNTNPDREEGTGDEDFDDRVTEERAKQDRAKREGRG